MNASPQKVQEWRDRAEGYREAAECCLSAEARENYLELAQTWTALADSAERQEPKH